MASPVEHAVSWAARRRGWVFAGAVGLLTLSSVGLRQLAFDADVLRLLPASGTAVPAFREYLERFGTFDDVYLVFTAGADHTIDDYDEEIDEWLVALRQEPQLSRVDDGRPGGTGDWEWLAAHQLLLLGGTAADEALTRLQPAGVSAAITESRALLALPSPEIAALVQQDPLRLSELLQRQLTGGLSAGSRSADPASGVDGYVTPDRRQRLIIARPVQPPYDTAFSHALLARLGEMADERSTAPTSDDESLPPLSLEVAGGHRIAVEAEAVVRRESITNGIGSLALILPLLFLVFRSPWLVLIGALPSAVSLLVVLGLVGLMQVPVSAAATGASAMLFGLGIDGVVLLYVAHRHARASGLDGLAAIRSLSAPAASMLLGMWTTAATFLGLVVVDFPSLEQLGALIGFSMLVCGVLTLFLVPASLSFSRASSQRMTTLLLPGLAAWVQRARVPVLTAALLCTLGAALLLPRLRVEPSLQALRAVTEGADVLERVTRDFQLPGETVVVIARGSNLELLLQHNEALVERLHATAPALALQAPSGLLPSRQTQQLRRRRVRDMVPSTDAVVTAVARAGEDAGFRSGSLQPFVARLPSLLAPPDELTWESVRAHGLGSLHDRFVARGAPTHPDGWTLATYIFPRTAEEVAVVQRAATGPDTVVTGIPLVNAELSARFTPQFARGLAVGSSVVLLLILISFRNWRLALLTLVPTVLGLTWTAGLLALFRYQLDLFAMFAVITFIGIGVDYGVHLVHRFRDRGDALQATAELAPVILVAGAITLLGYGTLIGSSYPPLRSIGIVSAVSVVTLVVTSVFVLPALLATFAGKERLAP